MSQTDTDDAFRIPYPFEFIIGQIPVSGQTKNSRSRENWEWTVRQYAQNAINNLREQYFLDDRPIMATIYYFPTAKMTGDIDNIVKPILDGMIGVAYIDDMCIERVVVQKFEPGIGWEFSSPSATLATVIDMDKPSLYIRLEDDLVWRQAS